MERGKYLAIAMVAVIGLGGSVLLADDDAEHRGVSLKGKYYLIPAADDYEHDRYEEYEKDERHEKRRLRSDSGELSEKEKKEAAFYRKECGSCHMAYQPEFLPKRSWKKMMDGLEHHFGTDAEMESEDKERIKAYLMRNAADSKPIAEEFKEIADGIASYETPLRISRTYYFRKEHRKIPEELIMQKEVRSISNCNACHTRAEEGSYSEREIVIPHYGHWED